MPQCSAFVIAEKGEMINRPPPLLLPEVASTASNGSPVQDNTRQMQRGYSLAIQVCLFYSQTSPKWSHKSLQIGFLFILTKRVDPLLSLSPSQCCSDQNNAKGWGNQGPTSPCSNQPTSALQSSEVHHGRQQLLRTAAATQRAEPLGMQLMYRNLFTILFPRTLD